MTGMQGGMNMGGMNGMAGMGGMNNFGANNFSTNMNPIMGGGFGMGPA